MSKHPLIFELQYLGKLVVLAGDILNAPTAPLLTMANLTKIAATALLMERFMVESVTLARALLSKAGRQRLALSHPRHIQFIPAKVVMPCFAAIASTLSIPSHSLLPVNECLLQDMLTT
jgi:hypothetical protein